MQRVSGGFFSGIFLRRDRRRQAAQTAEGGVPNSDIGILLPENLTVEILKSNLLEELSLSPQERAVQKENARRIWKTSWNAEKNYTEFVRLIRSLNL